MVRFFVEARSWDSPSPALVLHQTNAMLLGRLPSDSFVTAFLGVLSPAGLRYCNAGHLPPLHVRGTRVHALEGHGLALGIDPEPGYGEGHLDLAEGELVLAYTDGVTEARRGSETFGARRLARLLRELAQGHGPQELVRAIHEEIADWADGLSDDAMALAVRRRSASSPPPPPLECSK
jgi:sigma-B regulation protein RsbU (phosphoserine phosphatase)